MKLFIALNLLAVATAFLPPPPLPTPTPLAVLSDRTATKWSPDSWSNPSFTPSQMPTYDDQSALAEVTTKLSGFSPLVFAGEVRSLHEQLAKASQGQGFLLMGGEWKREGRERERESESE